MANTNAKLIKELNPGDSAGIDVAITSIEEAETAYGSTYLTVNFRDLSNGPEYSAKMFNASKDSIDYDVGDLCNLEIDCKLYRGNVSYNIKGINPVSDGLEKRDFAKHSPYSPEQMYNVIVSLLHEHNNPSSQLVETMYKKYKSRLLYWPAAKSMHHACHGGLLYHQLRMTLVAEKVTHFVTEDYLPHVDYSKFNLVQQDSTSVSQLAMDVALLANSDMSANDNKLVAQTTGYLLRLADLVCPIYLKADQEMVKAALVAYEFGQYWNPNLQVCLGSAETAILAVDHVVKTKTGAYNAEDIRLLKHCIGAIPAEDGNPSVRTPATMEGMLCFSIMELWRVVSQMVQPEEVADITAGAAIHDIGKLIELSSDEFGVGDYSVDGTLSTHLSLGCEMIATTAEDLQIPTEDITNLLYMVASHHRKRDWDAIIIPESSYSKILTAIDYLDSRMYVYEDEFDQLQAGEVSTNSSVRFMLGSNVYRSTRYPIKDDNKEE